MKEWAGKVTLSGIIIVFSMLVLLVLIIGIFGRIMTVGSRKPKVKQTAAAKPERTPASVKPEVKAAPVQQDDGDSVVAAISAAVAMMYEGTGKTPVIRSIKPSSRPAANAWKTAGVLNNTRHF